MKIDILKDGKLLYTITGTDDFDPDDIVMVSRKLIDGATMSRERFDDLFFEKMRLSRTQVEAYEKVEEVHFNLFGHNKYSSLDSYRVLRNKKK